jgi:hypothetical protein
VTRCHATVRRIGGQLRAFLTFEFANGEQLSVNGGLVRPDDGNGVKLLMPLSFTGSAERLTAVYLPDAWFKAARLAVIEALGQVAP